MKCNQPCPGFELVAMSIFYDDNPYTPGTSKMNICMLVWKKSKRTIKNAILNKSWEQHLTKQQLYSHLPPILQNIPSKINKTFAALLKR